MWLYLLAKYRRVRLAHVTSTVAFCIPLILFLAWRILYPDVFSGTAYRYEITRGGVVFGLLRLLNYNLIGDYVSNYWNFFNPNFLFLVGSPNFQSSTRAAGVFLIPVVLLLSAGVVDVASREKPRLRWLLIAGLVTAPIPAVLVEEPYAIYRELELLVFVIVLATYGARRLLNARRTAWRVVTAACLIAMPLQFGYFVKEYFTTYRLASYAWFGGNIKGAVAKVIELNGSHETPAVYLNARIPYAVERWHFYLAVAGREDLLARTRTLPATGELPSMPAGSLVVAPVEDRQLQDPRMSSSPDMRKVADIMEPFGDNLAAFMVFERP
jgi:hypothetical protein